MAAYLLTLHFCVRERNCIQRHVINDGETKETLDDVPAAVSLGTEGSGKDADTNTVNNAHEQQQEDSQSSADSTYCNSDDDSNDKHSQHPDTSDNEEDGDNSDIELDEEQDEVPLRLRDYGILDEVEARHALKEAMNDPVMRLGTFNWRHAFDPAVCGEIMTLANLHLLGIQEALPPGDDNDQWHNLNLKTLRDYGYEDLVPGNTKTIVDQETLGYLLAENADTYFEG